MDKVFFKQLELPEAKYNLDVGSGSHAEETGRMLIGIEKILLREKPDTVLVEGDTNTVLAGALAASKLHIKVGHVEAGLRSYDKRMPEEINRILTDHISDYLFAPTEKAREILLREGISEDKIFLTGNTIVDAVYQNLEIANKKQYIFFIHSKVLKDEPYTVYLNHKRIFDYVEDTCRTFANIVDNFKPGEVYNIGGRQEWEHEIKYISDLILKYLGNDDSKVTYKEAEPFTTKVKKINFSKAIRDLNHNP
ncbi:unnamed protein product, partial [marine sediment metagenome]